MRIEEIKILGDIDSKLIQPAIEQAENSEADAFLLRINSEGGDIDQAFRLISALKNTGKKFFAINEGFAISCGAIILAAADKAYGYPYSISLIHNPFYADGSEADEFLSKVKDSLLSILNRKIKVENLSELLSEETVWNASEALQYGLIDEIIGGDIVEVSNYNRDEVKSFYSNKIIFDKMDKELQEKIQDEMETKEESVETPAETPEVKEEAVETPTETKEETSEEVVNECGEKKEEEVKNEGEEARIAELERLLTEKDAYIAELESKLEEATGKKEEVINKETVNKISAEAIESIKHLFDSEAVLNDDTRLAEKIFDLNGDEALRLKIRNKQPELYNRLLEKYYSK